MKQIRYDTLGQLVYDSVPEGTSKALLYAELEPGVALVSLFYEGDDKTYYVEPSKALFDEVEKLQEQFDSDVRAIEFELIGEKFKTSFTYVEHFDDNAGDLGRREVVVKKHFGRSSVN